ncbi:hypothetical protein SAMN04487958_11724 [Vreelandella subterranea]|uniref:Nucleotidyltransferase substrate binding protein, HI0074 family n=1 Tax=Vreelandella subterranea TaxID=416874 RepID=A0A1H9WLX5_9GAMM|nr:hypothetical protein [Halomonas subterranea]SES34900.1 hypothetical protein SAMN04487958_11724 [Halomonas subterranea]
MNIAQEMEVRLTFLSRVVEKEIRHLEYADNQVFDGQLTYEDVENLDNMPELAMKVEAFASRFCRLQDTLGDKLLPALLKALGEPDRALLINLEKAEKYGWLSSSEHWVALRQLRNQMIHEYIEDTQTLLDALTTAHGNITVLRQFAERLGMQVQELLAK